MKPPKRSSHVLVPGYTGAFTLLGLLVVMGIVALLAGMLLPVVTRVRGRANCLLCANQIRELEQALLLNAQDNRDRLVNNLDAGRPYRRRGVNLDQNWVNNFLTWELDSDNTNLAFLSHSPLVSFVPTPEVFVCPSDRVLSDVQREADWSRRVRSMSLNAMVGDAGVDFTNNSNIWNPGYRQYSSALLILEVGALG